MSTRTLTAVCVAAAVFASVSLVAQQGTYRVPKTPWGEPDLQGTYNGNDLQGIPFQRATSVGTRTVLNDDEFRQRVAQRDQSVANDNSDEFSLERAEEFEKRFGTVGGAVSPPPHWLERSRNVSRVASYLIDPPDGRMPPMTPEAQKAQQARQAAQQARRRELNGIEADWTTDRSNYDRCISLGVQGSLTPKIYNSGNRIVQGPGWLAFQNEMIHETRVIPTDGRKNVGAGIKSWMGNSVGRWEGDTLVIDTVSVRNPNRYFFSSPPLSEEAHYVERLRMTGPDRIESVMTIEDPVALEQPYTVELVYVRASGLDRLINDAYDNDRSEVENGLFTIVPAAED